jgi:hypothetical protein
MGGEVRHNFRRDFTKSGINLTRFVLNNSIQPVSVFSPHPFQTFC